jgi:DNA polymerase (family 10)
MRLEDAILLSQKVCVALQPFCMRVVVAGSIRRGKVEVGDVDIVAVPKPLDRPGALGGTVHFTESQVWNLMAAMLEKKPLQLVKQEFGPELMRFTFSVGSSAEGLQVDVYHARPETWGVILLVRTGSKEHNVKLCSIARSKGLKLSASQGVLDKSGIIACRTEESIFCALGLAYVEPQYREVRFS